jgi:predicted transcriptional regulator
MSDLVISDALAQRLQEIAAKENRPVEAVLQAMVEQYTQRQSRKVALLAIDGMFDDNVTDLSTITSNDVKQFYRKKYADPG